MPRPDVIVVGAGTTGSVVAARMSDDPSRHVLLLEAGPGGRPDAGIDPFAAVEEPGRVWPDVIATRTAGRPPEPYLQGRGLGGSSAINGMVAAWGSPGDYDRWGVPGWSALELVGAVARVEATLPIRLVIDPGPLNRAVADTAAERGLPVGPLRVTATTTRRYSVADAYLGPAAGRPNLTVRVDATVERVLVAGGDAGGVRLTTGEELEGGEVVVCAGALHSPILLHRSGVDRPGLGQNLQDHPGVRIAVPLSPAQRVPDRRRLPFAVAVRDGAVQLLPMDHTGDVAMGGVLVVLLDSNGRGTVADGAGGPVVTFDGRGDAGDRDALAAALDRAAGLVHAAGFAADLPSADDRGDVFHAAGTCRMGDGAVVDDRLRVIGYRGLRVADASIVPELPRAHPMLTCALIGERLVELW